MISFSTKDLRGAFTLLELLAVITIIGILAAFALPMYARFMVQARETQTLSNMRQIGAAALLYAGDNNQQLPNRVSDDTSGTVSKWPTLLLPYLQNPQIFSSPIPPYKLPTAPYTVTAYAPVTDQTLYTKSPYSTNYTSYIYNGWSDMGAYTDSTLTPRLNLMVSPNQTILFAVRVPVAAQSGQFYMDFAAKDNLTTLNETAFPNGSPYTFGDGSARVLTLTSDSTTYKTSQPPSSGTYSDWYWLMNKSNTAVIQ